MAYWQRNIRTVYAPLPPERYWVEIIHETDRAILLSFSKGGKTLWVPKSACAFPDGRGNGFAQATFVKWFDRKVQEQLKGVSA